MKKQIYEFVCENAVRYTLLIFLVGAANQHADAQNIKTDKLEWSTSGFKDNSSGDEFSLESSFVTDGFKKITWIQDSGKSKVEWSIVSTEGSWTNLSQEGSVKLRFSDNQVNGVLSIRRTDGVFHIDLEVSGGTDNIKLTYHVSGVKKSDL